MASDKGIVRIVQSFGAPQGNYLVFFYKTTFERNLGGVEDPPSYTIHFDNSERNNPNVDISLSECDFKDNAGIQLYASNPNSVILDGCDFNDNGGNPTSFPASDKGGCVFIDNDDGLGITGPISFVKSKFKDTTGGMFYDRFYCRTLWDGCHGFRPIALHSYYPLYQNITYYSIMQTKAMTESKCFWCWCWCWCWCYICHVWG